MGSLGIWREKKEALVPQKKSDLNLKCHTSLEALKKNFALCSGPAAGLGRLGEMEGMRIF